MMLCARLYIISTKQWQMRYSKVHGKRSMFGTLFAALSLTGLSLSVMLRPSTLHLTQWLVMRSIHGDIPRIHKSSTIRVRSGTISKTKCHMSCSFSRMQTVVLKVAVFSLERPMRHFIIQISKVEISYEKVLSFAR